MGYFDQDNLVLGIEARVTGQDQVVALVAALRALSDTVGTQNVANITSETARAVRDLAAAEASLALAAGRAKDTEIKSAREVQRARQEETRATEKAETSAEKLERQRLEAIKKYEAEMQVWGGMVTAMVEAGEEAIHQLNEERLALEKLMEKEREAADLAKRRAEERDAQDRTAIINRTQAYNRFWQSMGATHARALAEDEARTDAAAREQVATMQRTGDEIVAINRRTEQKEVDQVRAALEEIRLLRKQALADFAQTGNKNAALAGLNQAQAMLGGIPVPTSEGARNRTAGALAAEQINLQNAITRTTNAVERQGFTIQQMFGIWWKFHAVLIAVRLVQDALRQGAEAYIAVLKPMEQVDQWRRQFEALTGSADTARQAIEAIRAEALHTPFETHEIAESALKVQAFGASWLQVRDAAEAVAAVMHIDLSQATEQLVRVTTGGLRGVRGLTINMAEVARELGIVVRGSISGDDVQNWALFNQILADLKVKFPDAVKQMSQSVGGEITQLKNLWFEFRTEVAEGGIGSVIAQDLQDALDVMRKMHEDGSMRALAKDVSDGMIEIAHAFEPVIKAVAWIGQKRQEHALSNAQTERALISGFYARLQSSATADNPNPEMLPNPGDIRSLMGMNLRDAPELMALGKNKWSLQSMKAAYIAVQQRIRLLTGETDSRDLDFPNTGKDHSGDIHAPSQQRQLQVFRQDLALRVAQQHAAGQALISVTQEIGQQMLEELKSQGKVLPGAAEEVENAVWRARMKAENAGAAKHHETWTKNATDFSKAIREQANDDLEAFKTEVRAKIAEENATGAEREGVAKKWVDRILAQWHFADDYLGMPGVERAKMINAGTQIVDAERLAGISDVNAAHKRDVNQAKRAYDQENTKQGGGYEDYLNQLNILQQEGLLSEKQTQAASRAYLRLHLDESLSYYENFYMRQHTMAASAANVMLGGAKGLYAQLQKETERYLLHRKTSAGVEVSLIKGLLRAMEVAAIQQLAIVLGTMAKEDAVKAARYALIAQGFTHAAAVNPLMAPGFLSAASANMALAKSYGLAAVYEGAGAAVAYGAATALQTKYDQQQSDIDASLTGGSTSGSGGSRSSTRSANTGGGSLRTVGVAPPMNTYITIATAFYGGVFMDQSGDALVAKIAPAIERAIENGMIKVRQG